MGNSFEKPSSPAASTPEDDDKDRRVGSDEPRSGSEAASKDEAKPALDLESSWDDLVPASEPPAKPTPIAAVVPAAPTVETGEPKRDAAEPAPAEAAHASASPTKDTTESAVPRPSQSEAPAPGEGDRGEPEAFDGEPTNAPEAAAGQKRPSKPRALPRPGMLAHGNEATQRRDFREETRGRPSYSSGVSPVPKGIVPPKRVSSEALPDAQRASFIDSVAEDLIASAEREAAEREKEAAGTDAVSVPHTAAPIHERAAAPRRRGPMALLGVAAAAAALLLFVAVGDDEPTPSSSPTEAQAQQKHELLAASVAAEPGDAEATQRQSTAVIEAAEDASKVDDADDTDDTDEIELEGSAPEETTPTDDTDDDADLVIAEEPSESESTTQTKKRKRKKRRSKRRRRSRETKPTSGSSSAATPTTAEGLRRAALDALGAGKPATAYRLAAQSNRKKRSAKSLRIMVKAACRMKSGAKAKAAFDRLSVSNRSGLRRECRRFGVKLGL